jgi:hypothetical protein
MIVCCGRDSNRADASSWQNKSMSTALDAAAGSTGAHWPFWMTGFILTFSFFPNCPTTQRERLEKHSRCHNQEGHTIAIFVTSKVCFWKVYTLICGPVNVHFVLHKLIVARRSVHRQATPRISTKFGTRGTTLNVTELMQCTSEHAIYVNFKTNLISFSKSHTTQASLILQFGSLMLSTIRRWRNTGKSYLWLSCE